MIIAGERRYRASRMAKKDSIPAVIKDLPVRDIMEIALIENLQREDLNPVEEALAYRSLINNHHVTQEEISEAVGKSRPHITNTIRLLNLRKEVLNMIEYGEITAGHGKALLRITDLDKQLEIANKIAEEGLSVRATENLAKKINLKEYVDIRYKQTLDKIEFLDIDSEETREKRKISYLTMYWFMQTLLDRTDRASMYNGLEVRVPFCDYRLVEYLWNIPWELKSLNGREKGLLRYIVKDILPSEIVNRKKSPYPKTHNPNYLEKVKNMLINIMNNKNAPIKMLLNEKYINEIIDTNGKSYLR